MVFFEQYSGSRTSPSFGSGRWPGSSAERQEAKRTAASCALAARRSPAQPEFLVADRYTIADIALYAYIHVAPEGGLELEPYQAVREWLTRVAAQPGHVTIAD